MPVPSQDHYIFHNFPVVAITVFITILEEIIKYNYLLDNADNLQHSIGIGHMVFNTNFNNISVTPWWSVLLLGETRSTRRNTSTYHMLLTDFIT